MVLTKLGQSIEKDSTKIPTAVLVSSGLTKLVTFSISNELSFGGGMYFPLLLVSGITGHVIINELDVQWPTTMSCGVVALPVAILPAPFTMIILAISMFNLSSRSGSTLVCVVTAHVLFIGLGIPHKHMSLAGKKNKKG